MKQQYDLFQEELKNVPILVPVGLRTVNRPKVKEVSPIATETDKGRPDDSLAPKATQRPRKPRTQSLADAPASKVPLHDRLILGFAGILQHVAFVVVTVADFVLECLFYSTFAPNDWSKIALASWGVVIVGAKLWAWSTCKTALAVFCACLSVIGSVGIFNASMDAQAVVARTINTERIEDPRLSIQRQIKALEANISAMTTERNALVDAPLTVRDYNAKIDMANAQLPELRKEMESIKDEVKTVEVVLDAWSIFGQVSGKIGVDPKAFAFCFILAVSILLQMIIAVTTPKKGIK